MDNFIKVVTGAVTGLALYFCSLNWQLLIIWFLLMILDILTGDMKHIFKGNWHSRDMKLGVLKKVGEFFLLIALILAQRVIELSGVKIPAGEIFAGIFAIKELGSIIENCIQMGIKVPDAVTKWFKVVSDKVNGKDDDSNGK